MDTKPSVDCANFLVRAITMAAKDRKLSPKGKVNASGACRVLLELAVDEYGEEGKQVLCDWNLGRSEDVYPAIVHLTEAGLKWNSEESPAESFAGLYDLNIDPSQWKLKWS